MERQVDTQPILGSPNLITSNAVAKSIATLNNTIVNMNSPQWLFSTMRLGSFNIDNTWGSVNSGNGYSMLFGGDQPNGGGLEIGEKGGQTYIQIDGDYYGREGAYPCAYLNYSSQGGSFYASNVYASSDRRLKENIKDATIDSLDIINKIKIKEYNFIADETKQKNVGVIAQELRETLPEDLVNFYIQGKETEDDHLSVNDSKLVYLLIDAIQKQQKEIAELRKMLEEIKCHIIMETQD